MMLSIAERVKLNPNVSDKEPAFLDEVVLEVTDWLSGTLNIPEGFVQGKGFSKSGNTASTDISGLANSSLRVSINGSAWAELSLTLGALTSGAAIATELQASIRAIDDADKWFELVTVVFDSTDGISQYTFTSAESGPLSAVKVSWLQGEQDVARALMLSPEYGGRECSGAFDNAGAQSLAVNLTQQWFRRTELEGFSDRVPSDAELIKLGTVSADLREGIVHTRRL